jgi:MFS family permease
MTSGLLFSKLYEKVKNKFGLMIIGIITASVTGLLFAISTNFVVSLILILIGGYAGSMVIASTNTTVQINLPIELRGRVISFFTFCLLGGMAFGSLLVALVVKILGPQGTYLALMIGYAVVSFIILFMNRKLLAQKMNQE